MVGRASAMEPKVKHVMFAEAPFALKRLSSITKPAAKKDMPKTKSMFERMEPAGRQYLSNSIKLTHVPKTSSETCKLIVEIVSHHHVPAEPSETESAEKTFLETANFHLKAGLKGCPAQLWQVQLWWRSQWRSFPRHFQRWRSTNHQSWTFANNTTYPYLHDPVSYSLLMAMGHLGATPELEMVEGGSFWVMLSWKNSFTTSDKLHLPSVGGQAFCGGSQDGC